MSVSDIIFVFVCFFILPVQEVALDGVVLTSGAVEGDV